MSEANTTAVVNSEEIEARFGDTCKKFWELRDEYIQFLKGEIVKVCDANGWNWYGYQNWFESRETGEEVTCELSDHIAALENEMGACFPFDDYKNGEWVEKG